MNYKFRLFHKEDAYRLQELFFKTVNHVNHKHYNEQQRNVWIENSKDIKSWEHNFKHKLAFVCEREGNRVGFIDATKEGYIDRLYIHHDYQNVKIATHLLKCVESELINRNILMSKVYASITAKDFFLAKGYVEGREHEVVRGNVCLLNYEMKKEIML